MHRHPASYRDPSGFIFKEKDTFLRQINPSYFNEYKAIKKVNIYGMLWQKGWLIKHEEIETDDRKIVLKPDFIDFITYPYEWSFTAYKHAAQLTLRIQLFLLEHDFSLKDASAFNVTFHKGKAIFIDTLSIEKYRKNEPWKALKQFNEHFFAPLLLAQHYGSHFLKSLQHRIDGFPLDEAAKMLPWTSRFNPTIYSHIHFLGKKEKDNKDKSVQTVTSKGVSVNGQIKMLKSLELHISNMELKENTEWSKYYSQINYDEQSFKTKQNLIQKWATSINAQRVIDLGGNDGTFSKVIADDVQRIIVCDIDQSAIDASYKSYLKSGKVTSLVTDLTQPAAAIGFNNQERDSFIDRVKDFNPDVSMALALIHHLSLTANVPFEMSAAFFKSLSKYLIIEFPDREDSWVQFILNSKRDAIGLFDYYNLTEFKSAYSTHFKIVNEQKISNTHRTMFLLERHEG